MKCELALSPKVLRSNTAFCLSAVTSSSSPLPIAGTSAVTWWRSAAIRVINSRRLRRRLPVSAAMKATRW